MEKEIDNLNYDELVGLYALLKAFNDLPKSLRKALLKAIDEKIQERAES